MRQLVYILFISNNHSSFHLCWNKKFGKVSESLKILCLWLHTMLLIIHWFSYTDYLYILCYLLLYSTHWLLPHIQVFTIHYSTRFLFLQITSSLLLNQNNRTNDVWGSLFWKGISQYKIFNFWKLKLPFAEIFHGSLKKELSWNLRYAVKLKLN